MRLLNNAKSGLAQGVSAGKSGKLSKLRQRNIFRNTLALAIIAAGISALAYVYPLSAESNEPAKKIWTLYFTNIKNQQVPLYVEVAKTETDKRRGLMFRESLDKNSGMIFMYKNPRFLNFWMKNTTIPLSIAFISAKLEVQEIYNMKPLDETFIRSTTKAQYAVEANNGWFRKNMIFHGSAMKIVQSDERKKNEAQRGADVP